MSSTKALDPPQAQKAKRNDLAPPEQRLDFRIGVNLGDIVVEEDDIHGDGVNIAHRIQALAEPGGIAISGTTYDHVKSKLAVGYASLGMQRVKNISDPIRVYRVVLDPSAAGKTTVLRQKLRVAAAAAAVVVLLGGGRVSRRHLWWIWRKPMAFSHHLDWQGAKHYGRSRHCAMSRCHCSPALHLAQRRRFRNCRSPSSSFGP